MKPSHALTVQCLFVCLVALEAVRDQAFIGYSEKKADFLFVLTLEKYGNIVIHPRTDISPGIVKLIHELAFKDACPSCKFYRHEPVPENWAVNGYWGPPYALLQGSMADLSDKPPFEGNPVVERGDVCIIPGSKEFFIATASHNEWGTAHSVWGKVMGEESWATIKKVPVAPFTTITDQNNITTRWLTPETHIPYKITIKAS